jgi:uncharacterized membrane protein
MMRDGGGGLHVGAFVVAGLIWSFLVLVIVVLLILLVVFAVRYLTRMNRPAHGPWPGPPAAPLPIPPARSEPLDILRERFAPGRHHAR